MAEEMDHATYVGYVKKLGGRIGAFNPALKEIFEAEGSYIEAMGRLVAPIVINHSGFPSHSSLKADVDSIYNNTLEGETVFKEAIARLAQTDDLLTNEDQRRMSSLIVYSDKDLIEPYRGKAFYKQADRKNTFYKSLIKLEDDGEFFIVTSSQAEARYNLESVKPEPSIGLNIFKYAYIKGKRFKEGMESKGLEDVRELAFRKGMTTSKEEVSKYLYHHPDINNVFGLKYDLLIQLHYGEISLATDPGHEKRLTDVTLKEYLLRDLVAESCGYLKTSRSNDRERRDDKILEGLLTEYISMLLDGMKAPYGNRSGPQDSGKSAPSVPLRLDPRWIEEGEKKFLGFVLGPAASCKDEVIQLSDAQIDDISEAFLHLSKAFLHIPKLPVSRPKAAFVDCMGNIYPAPVFWNGQLKDNIYDLGLLQDSIVDYAVDGGCILAYLSDENLVDSVLKSSDAIFGNKFFNALGNTYIFVDRAQISLKAPENMYAKFRNTSGNSKSNYNENFKGAIRSFIAPRMGAPVFNAPSVFVPGVSGVFAPYIIGKITEAYQDYMAFKAMLEEADKSKDNPKAFSKKSVVERANAKILEANEAKKDLVNAKILEANEAKKELVEKYGENIASIMTSLEDVYKNA